MQRVKSKNTQLINCATCGNILTKSVKCGTCEKHYDLRCANISEIGYRRMEFEGKDQWKCVDCHSQKVTNYQSPTSSVKINPNVQSITEYDKSETSPKPEYTQIYARVTKDYGLPLANDKIHDTKLQASDLMFQAIKVNSLRYPSSSLRSEYNREVAKDLESPTSRKIYTNKHSSDTPLSPSSMSSKSLFRPENTKKVTENYELLSQKKYNTGVQSSELLPLSSKSPQSSNTPKVTKKLEFPSGHGINNNFDIPCSEVTIHAIMNKLDSISSMLEALPVLVNDVKDIKTDFAKLHGMNDHLLWKCTDRQENDVQCECVQMKINSNILSIYGGIPPLVRLVSHENPEVCRNACGALRNLSYGRQNDENKRAIRDAGGIPALMALLCRATDMEVKELVTGVIWNMSSCEDLKQSIIDDAAQVIVNKVLIPHSGWHPTNPGDTYWSTVVTAVFRNSSGVLRNASSAGEYARRRLRSLPGLAEALLHAVRAAVQANAIGTKIVENCVCVLRNLSYRCQEIEDPLYDTRAPPTQSSGQARIQASASKGENLGCFGGSKKKKEGSTSSNSTSPLGKSEQEAPVPDPSGAQLGYSVPKGTEMLWSPEVVPLYMALLQTCSNPETLEAAAGALQNLAACYWQPSIDIRAAVRKEKGLPILVELLRMEVDRVVCAVATALRNLAIDTRNKELIGKYAMRDLVQKLPAPNQGHDQATSDDTIAAVLATLNEVIKKSGEFSRSLLEAGGVERLLNLTKQRHRHTARVLKFAGQVLMTMWSHAELREVYRKHGWREADFLTPARAAQPRASSNSSER